jgi:flagellar motor protein MotB
MKTTARGGLRAALLVLPALLAAGCASDPALTQRIHDLDQALAASRKANEELREKVSGADKAVAAAQAEVARLQGRDAAYQEAQARLSERLKELEGITGVPGGGGEDGGISYEKIPGGFKVVVQGEVLFNTGEADLRAEGKAALAKIADKLKGGTEKIRVEGHTDNVPISRPETKAKYPFGNLDLSLDRALRTADALIQEGIPARRVSCGGYGEHQPRSDNGTAEGKKKNRRVEILVLAE